jgi:hypothetical protein
VMSTSHLELEVMMRCSSGGTIVNNYPKSIVSQYFLRKKLETDEFLLGRAVTSSEPFDRSGPVPAAVRAAGYISEDEEETDEEGGSSMEEEETDDEQEADIVRSSRTCDQSRIFIQDVDDSRESENNMLLRIRLPARQLMLNMTMLLIMMRAPLVEFKLTPMVMRLRRRLEILMNPLDLVVV